MWVRYIIIIMFAIFAIACERESDMLEVEKMGAIVADLHIAEVSLEREDPMLIDSLHQLFIAKIAQIHGVTPEIITTNLEYLMEDPRRHEVVYQWAKNIMAELEQEAKQNK